MYVLLSQNLECTTLVIEQSISRNVPEFSGMFPGLSWIVLKKIGTRVYICLCLPACPRKNFRNSTDVSKEYEKLLIAILYDMLILSGGCLPGFSDRSP